MKITNDLPVGVSLKPQHFDEILHDQPKIGWFELHPENYMAAGGENLRALGEISRRYPLSYHSVGLSLGRAEGPDTAHLERLRELCARHEPALVSEHLAWTSSGGVFLNDLLPIPYNQSSLTQFCEAVDLVQNRLERRILIENPSQYAAIEGSEMAEADFLNELTRRSGCGLLLDLNNVYVCSQNLGFPAESYLEALDLTQVGEVHLAGHAETSWEGRQLLIDDHGSAVCDAVWKLYEHLLEMTGPLPTLIEWDTDVPSLPRLLEEAGKAQERVTALQARTEVHAVAV